MLLFCVLGAHSDNRKGDFSYLFWKPKESWRSQGAKAGTLSEQIMGIMRLIGKSILAMHGNAMTTCGICGL
jgi:hypothetical protein